MKFVDCTVKDKISLEVLKERIRLSIDSETMMYIGVDSQEFGEYLNVVVVIILHKRNKGGRLFYCREIIKSAVHRSLRYRILYETQKVTQVALELAELENMCKQIVVHLDINSDEQYKSNAFMNEATAYVIAQGFDCVVKPYSWAAFSAADRYTKRVKRSVRQNNKTTKNKEQEENR